MHQVLAALLVVLAGCSTGGRQNDAGGVPCETVVILASPGGYVACPGGAPQIGVTPPR